MTEATQALLLCLLLQKFSQYVPRGLGSYFSVFYLSGVGSASCICGMMSFISLGNFSAIFPPVLFYLHLCLLSLSNFNYMQVDFFLFKSFSICLYAYFSLSNIFAIQTGYFLLRMFQCNNSLFCCIKYIIKPTYF